MQQNSGVSASTDAELADSGSGELRLRYAPSLVVTESRLPSAELRRFHQHPRVRVEHDVRRRAVRRDLEPMTRLRQLDPVDLRHGVALGDQTNLERQTEWLSLLRLREL